MNNKESLLCGAFLKKMRQEKGWTLGKVCEETKILLFILKDLENDEYENLPPPIYLKGMIKKYADFLKLDNEKVLGLYQKSNGRNLSSGKYDLPPKNRFLTYQSKFSSFFKNVCPKILRYFFWGFILFYFLYEASFFILPAKIILFSPDRDFTTNQEELMIYGKIVRGKRFFIKDDEISFGENGAFNEKIILTPGINNIQFRAVNILGYETVLIRQIIYTSSEQLNVSNYE